MIRMMIRMMMHILIPMVAGVSLLCPTLSSAQSDLSDELPEGHQKLGQSADWEAFAYMQQGQKICALFSRPVAMSPRKRSPRKAYVIITRRPAQAGAKSNSREEFAMDAGQALVPDKQVILRIAQVKFQLFSGASRSGAEAQWAWPLRIKEEPRLIAAMKAGYDMEIRAELENGEKIRDLYSLSGVSRGIAILIENCP